MLPPWASAWFSQHYPAAKKAKAGPFRAAMTCSHFSTLKSAVENSDSISGAIPAALATDFLGGRFVSLALDAPKMYSSPGIVSLKGRTLAPAAVALVAGIRERMAKLADLAGGGG
jgi:DNA-binding transcriptional LysR family regulator